MSDDIWFIRGEAGVVFKMTPPLGEGIADRLLKGHLERVNEDGTPFVEAAERVKPAVNAPKAEWVGWAVANGETPDAAEGTTKTDLIERFG